MLDVRLIGPPRIIAEGGERRDLRGQKPWAVLARILLADRPLTRRELATELFPEADDPLGALRWCLAGLRRALGSADLLTGDPVRPELPPGIVVDVQELERGSLEAGPEAIGELLEGVDPKAGPEFSTWLLVARQQVASRLASRLREETIAALSRRRTGEAVRLAELAVRRSPFDEGAHVLLVKALVQAGDTDRALDHVAATEATFQEDLGTLPSPALRSAARARIADPPPGVSATAVASTLLDAGRAALSAGATDAGIDCLRRACAQAESAGDSRLHATALQELGSALVHAVRGFDDEGSLLLDEAARMAGEVGDVPTAVAALRERGYVDALAGRRPEAQHRLDHAATLAAGAVAEVGLGLLAGVQAVAAFNLSDWGRHDEAIDRYHEAVESARRAGDHRREAWARGLGGWVLLTAGQVPEAERWLTASLGLVRELRWVSFEPWPSAVLGEIALLSDSAVSGPRSSGGPDRERCFAMSCQLEDPCWEGASGRALALHHRQQGDLDAALRWIAEARTRCVRMPDTWAAMLGAILRTEADLRLAAGDGEGARAVARDLVALAASAHLDALLPDALALMGETKPPLPSTLTGRSGSARAGAEAVSPPFV